MPVIGSLILSACLAGAVQDRREIQKNILELTGEDADARREATRYLEALPLSRAWLLVKIASEETPAVRAALRAWLPHRLLRGTLRKATIGTARRKELDLFGPDSKKTPEDFGRVAMRLLEGEDADRMLALRILERVPSPEPRKLFPLLSNENSDYVSMAGTAIGRAAPALVLPEALKILRDGADPQANYVSWMMRGIALSEQTPALVEFIRNKPARAHLIVTILRKIGDGRAEEPLLAFLPKCEEKHLYGLINTLGLLGGKESIETIRSYRDGLAEDDRNRRWCNQVLVKLRDPKVSHDIIAGGKWSDELHRLADARMVPELVRGVKEGKFKLREKKSALELIGLLGSGDHVDLLLPYLKDDRFSGPVALGLAELGDPRASGPLAEALRMGTVGRGGGKALHLLPLSEVEELILQILDDPRGHPLAEDAIWIARRIGGAKVREKLIAIIADAKNTPLLSLPAVRALSGRLDGDDRVALRRLISSKNWRVRNLAAMALGTSGDRQGLEKFVIAVREHDISTYQSDLKNMLFAMDPEPPNLAAEVAREFQEHPDWFDGAEFLAHRLNPAGRALLVKEMGSTWGDIRGRAMQALLALGDVRAVDAFVIRYESYHWEPEREKQLARVIKGEALDRLRAMAWTQRLQNQNPARVLAYRRDPEMVPIFKKMVRSDGLNNQPDSQSNVGAMARALAVLGRSEMTIDFMRMLRSDEVRKRALGAECLAILGDPAAAQAIEPLLRDLCEIPRPSLIEVDGASTSIQSWAPEIVRVRDVATRAIEKLANRTFTGSPRERSRAAEAWIRENR